MASAAVVPPPRPLRAASARAASSPASSRSIGSRSPMSPVEHTAISPAESPRAAASRSALWWVSVKPAGPVHAFAPPELSSTARTRPPRTTCSVQSTGAALTRVVVNTAAAAREGPSFTTTARTGETESLRPAATPAARKPIGAVTLISWPPSRALRLVVPEARKWAVRETGPRRRDPATAPEGASCRRRASQYGAAFGPAPAAFGCSTAGQVSWGDSVDGQPGALRQPEHQVGDLDGLPGRPLDQVVQGGDHHGAPGMSVRHRLEVNGVRSRGRGRAGPAALGQYKNERLVGVRADQGLPGGHGGRAAPPRGPPPR